MCRRRAYAPWQRLNFLPLPHQHGSFRPMFFSRASVRRWVATEDDLVLVTGSLYVVGEARRSLRVEDD